jgi:hypothetical protein
MNMGHSQPHSRPRSIGQGARLFVLAAMALFGSCQVESPSGSTMSVDADSSWAAYDSLVLTLRDPAGNILETLFHAHFSSPRDLENLPAKYGGGKVTVVLEGYLDGRPVRRESREYDGRTGDIYAIDVVNSPLVPSSGAVLDVQPDNLILYLGGRKEVVGPGSTWVGDLIWTTGDTTIATVKAGELTAVGPGRTYVKAAAAGVPADSSWFEVKRDVPELEVGTDTSVILNSRVSWSMRVAQDYGTIEVLKWDIDGDGSWDDSTTGLTVAQGAFMTSSRLYDKAAKLTMRFCVRDGEQNIDSARRQVTVASKAPAVDSIGAKPSLVSIRDTIRFTAKVKSGEGALQSYVWDLDGNGLADDTGSFPGSSAQLTAARAFAFPGVYRSTLKLTDGLGSTVSGQVSVDVRKASPTAEAGPAEVKAKLGATVKLAGSGVDSLDGRIVDREWILGAAEPVRVDSLGGISFPAQVPGYLICIFRVTDDDGVTDDDTVRVEVVDGKAPDIAFLTPPDTLSIRDSLAMTVKAKGVDGKLSRYAWDFDGDGKWDDSGSVGTDSLIQTRGYRFEGAKVYLVAFRAVDAAGLSTTSSLTITVKEDRPWAKAGRDTTISLGERLVLQGQGGDTLGIVVKREWKLGDSAYSATPTGSISFTPAAAGELICVFRVTDDDGLTAQATVRVTVAASPLASLSDLALSAGTARLTLQQNFSPDRKAYTISVPFATDSVRIIPALPSGSGATIRVKGQIVASGTSSLPFALAVGANSLSVAVTAQDGINVETYTIVVTRQTNRDAALTGIVPSVGVLDPPFDSANTVYDLKLDSNAASFSLTLSPKYPTTMMTVNGLPASANAAHGPIDLLMGKNQITIVATAQAGTTRTYTIWVTRGPWIFVLDNFNARSRTSSLDGGWIFYDDNADGGASVVTSGDDSRHPSLFNDSSFETGRDGFSAARMAFTYGVIKPSGCAGTCPYGQFVALSNEGFPVTDMLGATQMSFFARASVPMRVRFKVKTDNILDFGFYRIDLDLTTQWTRYLVLLKTGAGALQQPAWASAKPFDLTKVKGFEWEISADENLTLKQGTFNLDDVVIQGWRGP